MYLTIFLALAIVIIATMLITVTTSGRWALWPAGALSGLQIHLVPIAGFFPSLALLSGLALWSAVLNPSSIWRQVWLRALVALLLVQILSLAWAPHPMVGIRTLTYVAPFLFIVLACAALSRSGSRVLTHMMVIALLASAVEALATIGFRILPTVKMHYITSGLARVFISANTIDALFDLRFGRNNIFDPGKSGGLFFVNANAASAYLGVAAMISWGFARGVGLRVLYLVALLDWIAVLFTGSKAGLLCALAVPACLWAFGLIRTRRVDPVQLLWAFAVLAIVPVGLYALYALGVLDTFDRQSTDTLDVRERIWSFALGHLLRHPIKGLGFGGWDDIFPFFALRAGINPNLPPHNSLIILWTQSGVCAVLLGVTFIVSLMSWLASLQRTGTAPERCLAMGAIGAFSWYFLQGFGENFGLLGEEHMTPLLALALGQLICVQSSAIQVESPRTTAAPPPGEALARAA